MPTVTNAAHELTATQREALDTIHRKASVAAGELRSEAQGLAGASEFDPRILSGREYPARLRRGMLRGSLRLHTAADALEAVATGASAMLGGSGAGTTPDPRSLAIPIAERDPKAFIGTDAAAARGVLSPFEGKVKMSAEARTSIRRVEHHVGKVAALKGAATLQTSLTQATTVLTNFETYLSGLDTHATRTVRALEAWNGDTSTTPGYPPFKLGRRSKTRTPGPSGSSKPPRGSTPKGTTPPPGGTNGPGGGSGKPPGPDTTKARTKVTLGPDVTHDPKKQVTGRPLQLVKSQVGVREIGTSNTGKKVNEYLASTKTPPGQPWCAAFIHWAMTKGGFKFPAGYWASCRQYQLNARADGGEMYVVGRKDARPGDLIVWGNRHIGMVERAGDGTIHYIAGNESQSVARGSESMGDSSYTIIRPRDQS